MIAIHSSPRDSHRPEAVGVAAWFGWGAVAVLLAMLAGCATTPNPNEAATANAVPRAESPSASGNPASYTVNGHTYRVLRSNAGYHAQGVASWYGPKFQGRLTSSGERYNMYAMTAAHKTLRLPAYVRVTNLENHRSVIVRVNDRGPFVSDRIIDLSYAAAKKIGMLGSGTALVDLHVVGPGDDGAGAVARPVAAPHEAGGTGPALPHAVWGQDVYIQVGAFAEAEHVRAVRQRLARAGIAPVRVTRYAGLQRVRIGPIASLAAYDQLMGRLDRIGFIDAQMVVE